MSSSCSTLAEFFLYRSLQNFDWQRYMHCSLQTAVYSPKSADCIILLNTVVACALYHAGIDISSLNFDPIISKRESLGFGDKCSSLLPKLMWFCNASYVINRLSIKYTKHPKIWKIQLMYTRYIRCIRENVVSIICLAFA